ncbi:succinyldiaminopimelate transaminase [Caldichromatium japonicum]|uniref:Succinyldiaminopimelate transaminase n=1 Tax=Caldichromatium japonicum TaxID=2699430 RepID=A0A6G7VEG3_9GAMM|nr:succinyldiaminopimelate transaminase [Caldichromatium japonicum]QIK38342.1 succinyldiaminopimelate transaminase [Caldichromatium japonicum]
MNPELSRLLPYPFERLRSLLHGIAPPADRAPIALQIGEPKHPTPSLIVEALTAHLDGLAVYPLTQGLAGLRQAIAEWIERRFRPQDGRALDIDPERQVLPVNGTREALFAIAQAVVDRSRAPLVLMPNPCYQIYEGAALLAGAEPYYLPCRPERGLIPDFEAVDATTWQRCQLLYLCSPGNPTGAVLGREVLAQLIALAERYGFVIAADECYSELYWDEDRPPPGLLQVAAEIGNTTFKHCLVFHSLSKRSNAPGLRSGFVAGDAELVAAFLRYRTYHGCAMPPPIQYASLAAWRDEAHVQENRALYRQKFAAIKEILDPVLPIAIPAGGFFLWPKIPIADTEFARLLYAQEHVSVLPGRFLSRCISGEDPGADRVRIALVPSLATCIEAAWRMRACLERLERAGS